MPKDVKCFFIFSHGDSIFIFFATISKKYSAAVKDSVKSRQLSVRAGYLDKGWARVRSGGGILT